MKQLKLFTFVLTIFLQINLHATDQPTQNHHKDYLTFSKTHRSGSKRCFNHSTLLHILAGAGQTLIPIVPVIVPFTLLSYFGYQGICSFDQWVRTPFTMNQ